MPRKPEQLKSWTIYKVAAKAIWLGSVEAPDKKAAIEIAAKELTGHEVRETRIRWEAGETVSLLRGRSLAATRRWAEWLPHRKETPWL